MRYARWGILLSSFIFKDDGELYHFHFPCHDNDQMSYHLSVVLLLPRSFLMIFFLKLTILSAKERGSRNSKPNHTSLEIQIKYRNKHWKCLMEIDVTQIKLQLNPASTDNISLNDLTIWYFLLRIIQNNTDIHNTNTLIPMNACTQTLPLRAFNDLTIWFFF